MKKWILFLALPYVVTISTYQIQTMDDNFHPVEKIITDYNISNFPIAFNENQKDIAEDMAAALNKAHEERENKKDVCNAVLKEFACQP